MMKKWKLRVLVRIVTWLWILPVLLIGSVGGVKPGGWLLIGFLGLVWAGGIWLQVRNVVLWLGSFTPESRLSAFRVRTTWPLLADSANLLDADEDGPVLVSVTPQEAGWRAELDTFDHGRETNALKNRRGDLRRRLGLRRLDVNEVDSGTVALRGFTSNPLTGIRWVETVGRHRDGMRLGRLENGGDLFLDTDNLAGHIALQGAPRFGKSVLLYGILSQLASHANTEVWGIDPSAVLLNPFEGARGERACGLADKDQVVHAVQQAVRVMDSRLEELRVMGVDKIKPSVTTPRLLMVLEEYPGTVKALADDDAGLKPAERRGPRVRSGISRLIAEGAKVGVTVVMISQRFDASIVGGAERANISYRFTFHMDNSDGVRMLHEGASPELIEQITTFEPGTAVSEFPGEGCRIFQADYMEYAGDGGYFETVREAVKQQRRRYMKREGA